MEGSIGRRDSVRRDRPGVIEASVAANRIPDGNGTPKNRCRLTHQSPVSPFTQFS